MQNAHGKEIDLLRVTVKVPGKRPPRAVAPAGPSPAAPASSGINGLTKESAAAEATGTGTEDRFPSFHCLTDEQAKVSPRHKRLDGLLAEFLSFFCLGIASSNSPVAVGSIQVASQEAAPREMGNNGSGPSNETRNRENDSMGVDDKDIVGA